MEAGLKLNILVVDDNQINRLLINKVLLKWGIVADFAENGLQAIGKIEANLNYDVVLMDVYMPEMGGIEATKIIRARPEPYFKQLGIVALTASIMDSEKRALEEAGMSDYLTKPFEPKVLYEKLSKYQL